MEVLYPSCIPGAPGRMFTRGAGMVLYEWPPVARDSRTTRPDANPQGTGRQNRAAHPAAAEDARRHEREADARGQRHPGQRQAILFAILAGASTLSVSPIAATGA